MTTSMIKPMGYLSLRWRLVVALVVGIFVATVMLLFTTSEKPAAQTTMRPGQQIIAAGNVHSLALKKDGTVWAWGWNAYGQLGTNSTIDYWGPVPVYAGSGLYNGGFVTDVDVGDVHSLALKNNGTVWAWGNNQYGQLGVGDIYSRSAPVQVKGLADVINVEAGDDHNLAVKKDGTVWAWGNNDKGQLGDGTTAERHTPVLVSSGTFTGVGELAGGYHHSLALKDGKVWSWGSNNYGQLGTNSTTDHETPVAVYTGSGLTGVVKDVDAGFHHSLALEDGKVWAWGGNSYGQLGDNTVKDRHAPVQVYTGIGPTAVATDVAAGYHHSLALEDGKVWAWGGNSYGQLGDDTVHNRHVPVQVYTGSGLYNGGFVTDVDAGDYHSLAVKSDGTVWAWGDNDRGQLGDGTIHDRHTPVQVSGLTDVGPPAASLPPGAAPGEKAAICYKKPGRPYEQTLNVPYGRLRSLLNKGATLGACSP